MSKLLKNLLKATPLVLGASALTAGTALASPLTGDPTSSQLIAQAVPSTPQLKIDPVAQQQLDRIQRAQSGQQINTGVYQGSMSQVTSVNQLRDVAPTAWAYEALRSLVERYGCIVGFPDRTFRGDRATTRWEFAAGLNACLNVMERLIQDGVTVLKEDIDKLKRLFQEFESELAALGARIDNLEQRTAFLEDNQFSTTTKLRGEVVFSVADSWGGTASRNNSPEGSRRTPGNDADRSQTVFNDRVRLNFDTSFTGKDLLRTRLQAGNFNNTFNQAGPTGTNMTRLAYDSGSDNDVTIDKLFYRAPIGTPIGPVTLWVGVNQLNLNDVFETNNPYFTSSGTGALTRLQRFNNIVFRGPSGAGAALRFNIADVVQITGTYLAQGGSGDGSASNPNPGSGLFNGGFSAGAQVNLSFVKFANVSFVYVHSYLTSDSIRSGIFGNVSSPLTERPFGNVATTADRFGLQASAEVVPGFLNIAAWGGYANATAQGGPLDGESTDIWSWNANISLLDLFSEGTVLSVGGGQPPRSDLEDSTSYLIEAQFKLPITKNILLTPGAYVLFNANNTGNETIYVAVLRTTFQF